MDPPPHSLSSPGLTYTFSLPLSPSAPLCFIPPSSYLSKPLCGAPPLLPSPPLSHYLSLFLHPPYTPPCCFGAAACLLATTAHPLELSECFYKHTQEDTLIHAHTRRHTHTYAGKRKHIHTLTQGLVPH